MSTIGKSLGHAKGSKMALRYVERDRARHAAALQVVEQALWASSQEDDLVAAAESVM